MDPRVDDMLNQPDHAVRDRLKLLLKTKRMTQTEFAEKIGVCTTYVAALRRGLSPAKLQRVQKLFPDLNRDWLLFGIGDMLVETEDTAIDNSYLTPLLPVTAYAGSISALSTGVGFKDCPNIVSPVPDVDCAIPVRGDSMAPMFSDGATLLLKRIKQESFIPWGHPMVIDTCNGVMVKMLFPAAGNDKSYLVAHSVNPNYPDFQLPTEDIYGIYRVIGSFTLYP